MVPTNATASSGTFIQNTDDHEKLRNRKPPTMGPRAMPAPLTAVQMAIALARSSGSPNALTRMDNVVGMTTVRTTAGEIKGYDKGGIHYFKGVPFAAPPVGDLRFAPPQPPVPWQGTRDATEDGPICPQAVLPLEGPLADVISATQPQDEDCLTLTVTTPAVDGSLPVMMSSAPTRAEMDDLREQSARLARDLARLSIDLREELAKAVDAVRLAQVANAAANGNGNGNPDGHGDEPYADLAAPEMEMEVIDLTEVRHTYP